LYRCTSSDDQSGRLLVILDLVHKSSGTGMAGPSNPGPLDGMRMVVSFGILYPIISVSTKVERRRAWKGGRIRSVFSITAGRYGMSAPAISSFVGCPPTCYSNRAPDDHGHRLSTPTTTTTKLQRVIT
jgi:hypothetical protein